MKMKNILAALMCVIFFVTLLSGCTAQKPNENTDTSNDASLEAPKDGKKTETETESTDSAELTYLRTKIKETGATVGVAYVGFVSNNESVADYNYASDFSTNGIFKEYPFFYEYPVSVNVGHDMFCVVPVSTQSHIKVYKVNFGDGGELSVDKESVLYEDKTGKPFFVLCNEHEAYSNILIEITSGDETVEISPRIAIENADGLVLGEGCYEFTVKDIRDYKTAVKEYLSENVDEIKDGIEDGLILMNDYEEDLYGHYVLKFKLGRYDDDGNFYTSREYMVDEYYTFAYYEPEAGENTRGWRMVGKGFDYRVAG